MNIFTNVNKVYFLYLTVVLPLNPGFFTTPEAFESWVIITSAEFAAASVRTVVVPFTLTCLF